MGHPPLPRDRYLLRGALILRFPQGELGITTANVSQHLAILKAARRGDDAPRRQADLLFNDHSGSETGMSADPECAACAGSERAETPDLVVSRSPAGSSDALRHH